MAVICQALPVTRPTKAAPAQQPGPLVRPHGFSQARRTVPYAFNPAISSFGDGMGVPVAPFVRPDCPPDAEDAAGSSQRQQRRPKSEGQRGARPQFRSALEQVSYMTNSKLWSEEESTDSEGKFRPLRFLGL